MTHKLLNSIDYNRLAQGELKAPHIPTLVSPTDGRNFDNFDEPEPPAKSEWEADLAIYLIKCSGK